MEARIWQDPARFPAKNLAEAQTRFDEFETREKWLLAEVSAGRGTPEVTAELAAVSGFTDVAFDQLEALGGLDPPVDETG
ncbi:MAG: hypothetical protein ABIP38_10700 [Steroidobacteraceae bacterium]